MQCLFLVKVNAFCYFKPSKKALVLHLKYVSRNRNLDCQPNKLKQPRWSGGNCEAKIVHPDEGL